MTMTMREMYTMVIDGNVNEDVISKCKEEIAKLDKRNSSRSSQLSKVQIENAPIKEAIVSFLYGKEATLTTDIAEALEKSTNKVGALCRQLRDEGRLVESDVKVKGKGIRKAYALAQYKPFRAREKSLALFFVFSVLSVIEQVRPSARAADC